MFYRYYRSREGAGMVAEGVLKNNNCQWACLPFACLPAYPTSCSFCSLLEFSHLL